MARFCVNFSPAEPGRDRPVIGTRNGFVHRHEEVPAGTGGKEVVEFDADRPRFARIRTCSYPCTLPLQR